MAAVDHPDYRVARYLEALNQLVGFDNTIVASGVVMPAWGLMKTITMVNFANRNLHTVAFEHRVAAAGDIGTLQFRHVVDGAPEVTFYTQLMFGNIAWQERTVFIAPPLTGNTILIRVYGNVQAAGDIVYNQKCECFGDVRQLISYV